MAIAIWAGSIALAARAVAVGCARDINALPRYRRRAPFRGPCGSAPRPRRQAKFQPRRWLCGARLPADLRNCRIRLSERVALAVFPLLFQSLWVKLYHEKVAGLRQVWVPVSPAAASRLSTRGSVPTGRAGGAERCRTAALGGHVERCEDC